MSADPSIGGPLIVGEGYVSGPPITVGGNYIGGPSLIVTGGAQIADVSTAPLDVPVALVRGSDGLLRPAPTAITDRPTRAEVADSIADHVNDVAPHPVYDDVHSFRILYENRLI